MFIFHALPHLAEVAQQHITPYCWKTEGPACVKLNYLWRKCQVDLTRSSTHCASSQSFRVSGHQSSVLEFTRLSQALKVGNLDLSSGKSQNLESLLISVHEGQQLHAKRHQYPYTHTLQEFCVLSSDDINNIILTEHVTVEVIEISQPTWNTVRNHSFNSVVYPQGDKWSVWLDRLRLGYFICNHR